MKPISSGPLPTELYEADSVMAVRVLVKTISVVILGYLFSLYMPAVFTPFCVLLLGAGMSALYLVGYQCSQRSFFRSETANAIAREISWIPLLTSLEGDRFGYWGARLFALIMLGSLSSYFGVEEVMYGFFKYWILPFLVMRMNLRKLFSEKEAANLLLFPELAEGSYSNLFEKLKNVPFYKMDQAFAVLGVSSVSKVSTRVTRSSTVISLQSILSKIWDTSCSLLPSHYMMREMLYWRKRDLLLEIVLGLSLGLIPLHYYEIVPPQAFYLPFFLFLAGFTRRAVTPSKVSTLIDGLHETKAQMACVFNDLKVFASELHLFNLVYIGGVHVWAFIGVFTAVPHAAPKTFLLNFICYILFGFGITAGAHRLWSHRSYKAHSVVEFVLMLCNSGANQGSIWHWCRDHRVHHRYSDTDQDPHNSQNGMFYSHVGWLFLKKSQPVVEAGRAIEMGDLKRNRIVMFQKKFYVPLGITLSFIIPTLIPMYFWNESFLVALTLCYIRYAILLNATWCVNSLAHFYGMRPYRPESPTCENFFVALIALGEGWHNYHHAYPWDYSTSELGVMNQFNPSKLLIDALAYFGLTWNRKRADHLGRATRLKIEQGIAPDVAVGQE
mmetsp:Transcript_37689/g.52198  ORF Transcript_37689/g.52198 Transcript_37689/m.52198 type:complete len:612 (-) Transcript_37689:95-1930(-)|eukprot:CAMPEP_0201490402 /NCGR_PEP_ID=MMETSP0151_2-20130828/26532_1 /ASSEMBLY_ACC=CAM_ASM_000257 /TAXON_ID=200890 /ORGANISM="Paramoeba atlantica, Strain 621/1 / CCAP 1560/9" /LENGTH=611 /DNA_ID=CAMNT_0047876365 /DNA_START=59 /DNA_END=1894 /DNA_ORIENTATION=+